MNNCAVLCRQIVMHLGGVDTPSFDEELSFFRYLIPETEVGHFLGGLASMTKVLLFVLFPDFIACWGADKSPLSLLRMKKCARFGIFLNTVLSKMHLF